MDTKHIIKEKYSAIAKQKKEVCGCGCSCSSKNISQQIGYTEEQLQRVGEADLGLGCGNPVAFSSINEGDTVLDLGSGAGIDCFLASKKVGSDGKVIGIDFTEEMIIKAKANALKGKFINVKFILADIDKLPVKDNSVNIIISNCVINLAPDKNKVFNETFRILKPGGKIFVSDIVLLEKLSEEQKKDKELIAGCVAGALLKDDYIEVIKQSGFKIKILNENKEISKQQYRGIPLESLLLEGIK